MTSEPQINNFISTAYFKNKHEYMGFFIKRASLGEVKGNNIMCWQNGSERAGLTNVITLCEDIA